MSRQNNISVCAALVSVCYVKSSRGSDRCKAEQSINAVRDLNFNLNLLEVYKN